MRTLLFSVVLLGWVSLGGRAEEVALEIDSVAKDYAGELPRIPATEPPDALSKFQIDDGFRIELAAHEPLISDPISMAFDEHGRLFVVCMRGYSEHRHDRLGVVRMLEDTDDDGVFDRGTDYVTGLAWPTAVACYDGGIFVGAPPHILYCKDTNDDGVADEKKTVFSGFGHQNVQGMMNSFRWGLDNHLYGASGTNGGDVEKVGSSASTISLRGKGFSIQPATLSLRAESGNAQHGATIGRWGERYVCSNSDHLRWVEYDERYLRRNPLLRGYASTRSIAVDGPAAEVFRTSDVEPWRVVRTRLRVKGLVSGPVEGGGRAAGYFTSASGVTVYSGDAFDAKFREKDHVFVGDVGSNLVHLKKIESQGLDQRAVRATADGKEFLTSTDNWFRPVQFANGPDGALYVIDMYRETIEHPLSLPPMIKKHVDLNSGRKRGRIYRLAPTDWKRTARQLPGDASDAELVATLSHPNGWHRETAARLIVLRAEQQEQRREELAEHLRLACVNGTPIGRVRALYCLQSINRLSEGVLVKQLEDQHAQVRRHALKVVESATSIGEATVGKLLTMVEDPDLFVRYQLALTLGHFDWDVRCDPLTRLATRAEHRKMQFAVLSSMGDQRIELLDQLLDKGAASLNLLERICSQIGRKKEGVSGAIDLLMRQPAQVREPLIASLLLETGFRGDRLLAYLSSKGVANATEIVADVIARSHQQALEVDAAPASRVQAIRRMSLGEYDASKRVLKQLLSPVQSARVRDAVVELLGRYDSIEVAESLVSHLSSLSPLGRRKALNFLASRSAWAMKLLHRMEDGTLSQTQVSSRHRQQLLRHGNKEIAGLAKELLGDVTDRAAVVEQFASVLTGLGDATRGKLLFGKVCASCHRLDGSGANVGPDLQPLRNRGAEFMLTNILDPNREVDPRYEAYTVLTSDGRTHTGILSNDTVNSVALLLADGATPIISKDEIEQLQATGRSLMPEGLELELTKQGIADVIAYLIQVQSPINSPKE